MRFNEHYELEGRHALLSPSQYHWVNYTDEKLSQRLQSFYAAERGTQLHAYAATAIQLRRRQPRNNDTVNQYINDAIGYSMTPEQPLKYSDYCFGTADTIVYNEKKHLLRIHDLKTGVTPASMTQLLIYAAIFCLEYQMDPEDMCFELRIYQNNEVQVLEPSSEDIRNHMDRIVYCDRYIRESQEV